MSPRGAPLAAPADAQDDPTGGEGDSELSILVEAIAIEDRVAVDPVDIRPTGHRNGSVLVPVGLHPPLKREILPADIDRGAWVVDVGIVDGDLDAIDVAGTVAMEAQRVVC